MDPDTLNEMLGPGHNVPWDRLESICEQFNAEARRIAKEAIAKHEAECHAHQTYLRSIREPFSGPEWRRIPKN